MSGKKIKNGVRSSESMEGIFGFGDVFKLENVQNFSMVFLKMKVLEMFNKKIEDFKNLLKPIRNELIKREVRFQKQYYFWYEALSKEEIKHKHQKLVVDLISLFEGDCKAFSTQFPEVQGIITKVFANETFKGVYCSGVREKLNGKRKNEKKEISRVVECVFEKIKKAYEKSLCNLIDFMRHRRVFYQVYHSDEDVTPKKGFFHKLEEILFRKLEIMLENEEKIIKTKIGDTFKTYLDLVNSDEKSIDTLDNHLESLKNPKSKKLMELKKLNEKRKAENMNFLKDASKDVCVLFKNILNENFNKISNLFSDIVVKVHTIGYEDLKDSLLETDDSIKNRKKDYNEIRRLESCLIIIRKILMNHKIYVNVNMEEIKQRFKMERRKYICCSLNCIKRSSFQDKGGKLYCEKCANKIYLPSTKVEKVKVVSAKLESDDGCKILTISFSGNDSLHNMKLINKHV